MFEFIFAETRGRVGIMTLNRPDALNALNAKMQLEIIEQALSWDADPDIGSIIIKGNERAFAAGADIRELVAYDAARMRAENKFSDWEDFANLRTPKIAAVSGYALGGGCELALMCNIIIADQTAKFGQPEVKIGCIPGMGGTQRLTRAIGKVRAADMVLTGRIIDASTALDYGLASQILPTDGFDAEVLSIANEIAERAADINALAIDALHAAQEEGLSDGLKTERAIYHGLFGTSSQSEGMAAFLEKRTPKFR